MNWDKPQEHQCTKRFKEMTTPELKKNDYINLQCTCERHTYCKPGYCLRRRKVTEKNYRMVKLKNYHKVVLKSIVDLTFRLTVDPTRN